MSWFWGCFYCHKQISSVATVVWLSFSDITDILIKRQNKFGCIFWVSRRHLRQSLIDWLLGCHRLRQTYSLHDCIQLMSHSPCRLMRVISLTINQSLMAGQTLSESFHVFQGVCSPRLMSALYLSETLGDSMRQLKSSIDQLQMRTAEHREVLRRCRYPCLLLVILYMCAECASQVFVPQYQQLAVSVSGNVTSCAQPIAICLQVMHLLAVLLCVIVFLVLFIRRANPQHKVFGIIYHVLNFSRLFRRYQESNVIETLSHYLSVNVGLGRAFKLMLQDRALTASSQMIRDCWQRSMSGQVLSDVLSGFECCNQFVSHRIRLAEHSGSLSEVLIDVSRQEKQHVFQIITRILKMLSPLLMIVFAVVLMILFSALYQPLMNFPA